MKKILFIDRDGTIITEPPEDYQVDSFEKLEFLPGTLTYLGRIAMELDYQLVMVTNQDGLGTDSFPAETFWGPHNLMMRTLESMGVYWRGVIIDESFPKDNSPNRKPAIGRVGHYLKGEFDMANSYVIGDRLTDMIFAQNLGAKGILIGRSEDTAEDHLAEDRHIEELIMLKTTSWKEIYNFLKGKPRRVKVNRSTFETKIDIELDLDGSGATKIETGLAFFDHMLDQLGKHGGVDLNISVDGDLHIDEHHTIEDTALALGQAFLEAMGSKRGMERYGYALPMDDCEAMVTLDFGGRPWIVWDADFRREKIGDMPTEMFFHFFK